VKRWYVMHTKPSAEKRVALTLRQRGIDSYLPLIFSKKGSESRSEIRRLVPFFPGYFFAELDLEEGSPFDWLWIPGFRRVVSYGDEAIPVPDEVITLVKHKLADLQQRDQRTRHDLSVGDLVRIKNGPFNDMLAVFEGPTTPSARVQILMTGMNRSIRMRIDAADLEKASDSSPNHGSGRNARSHPPRRTRGRGRRIR
jgi:transcription antitermination factor NusG